MKFLTIFIVATQLFITSDIQGQKISESPTHSHRKLYATLYHQHHDFFDKAFSLQGLEVGFIFHKKFSIGLYGSCFVTNLKAEINNKQQYIWLGQSGMHLGYIHNSEMKIHPGFQLNTGVFSLRADKNNFGLFETNRATFKLSGLVISSQIFGELNLTAWFNIRTGLSYNLYTFKDSPIIQPSDLNHLSFTFGMVFFLAK